MPCVFLFYARKKESVCMYLCLNDVMASETGGINETKIVWCSAKKKQKQQKHAENEESTYLLLAA